MKAKDLQNLETLKKYFEFQAPSNCGPTCATIMLRLQGHTTTQKEMAKLSETHFRNEPLPKNIEEKDFYGTNEIKLIEGVKKVTKGKIEGKLIPHHKIQNLKEEIKYRFHKGMQIIFWIKKGILFPESTTGHYILGIGVKRNKIIVMDPSQKSAGIYAIPIKKLNESMGRTNKERGYLVFGKKEEIEHNPTKKEIKEASKQYQELEDTYKTHIPTNRNTIVKYIWIPKESKTN
jgi:hypothetical protein